MFLDSDNDHYIHFLDEETNNDLECAMPPPGRQSTHLTIKLLKTIKASISTFRPSQSLASFGSRNSFGKSIQDLYKVVEQTPEPKADIDIVISGGGLKGYFMAGCSAILMPQLQKHKINIARIAGASAGSWSALFMICGIKMEHWIETYHTCFDNPDKLIHEAYEDAKRWLMPLLPDDAYEKCSGRLFISVSFIKWWGVENRMISDFYSNDDLVDCCFASSTIPYLTERGGLRRFRGELVCDGGLTNNCPVFPDGSRRQLVFRLYEVEYPYRLLVNAKDTCIDALILRGGLLMARFLQGEKTDSIAWLEEKNSKATLEVRPNYYFRLAMIPFAVGGLILSRGSGLSALIGAAKGLLSDGLPSTIIPFEEAGRYFGMAPWRYALGALMASVVDMLGSMNLLL